MRGFWKLTTTEIRLFFREPVGTFFTIGWPILLLFLFGGMSGGNRPMANLGGRGAVDMSVPSYMAMIAGTIAFIALPVDLSSYREMGVLRRFSVTPLSPWTVQLAQFLANLAASLLGTILLVFCGRLVYNMHTPASWLSVIVSFLFCTLSLSAIGFVLAAIVPSARAARAVGMAVFFPMLFLSGALSPRTVMPSTMQHLGDLLPLTYAVNMLRDAWFGQAWSATGLIVLGGICVVGILLSARIFRWQ